MNQTSNLTPKRNFSLAFRVSAPAGVQLSQCCIRDGRLWLCDSTGEPVVQVENWDLVDHHLVDHEVSLANHDIVLHESPGFRVLRCGEACQSMDELVVESRFGTTRLAVTIDGHGVYCATVHKGREDASGFPYPEVDWPVPDDLSLGEVDVDPEWQCVFVNVGAAGSVFYRLRFDFQGDLKVDLLSSVSRVISHAFCP